MSRPKLTPKTGDTVLTPERTLGTVLKVEGAAVDVQWFDAYQGRYRLERYAVKDLRKVHEPAGC